MASITDRRPGPFDTGPIAAKEPGPIEAGERDSRFDNQPPLGERIMLEFEEELRKQKLIERADELIAAVRRAPDCDSEESAGKIGDFVKQMRTFETQLEAVREKHNRPLLDAKTALKRRTDLLFAPLAATMQKLRGQLDDFARAERQRVERERREAEELAMRQRREAARAAVEKEEETGIPAETFMPKIETRQVESPVARGDYGARVGGRTVWCHEIESVRKLPDRLLKHPKVLEALDKIIAAEIKAASGKCEIGGVRIWQDTKAAVR